MTRGRGLRGQSRCRDHIGSEPQGAHREGEEETHLDEPVLVSLRLKARSIDKLTIAYQRMYQMETHNERVEGVHLMKEKGETSVVVEGKEEGGGRRRGNEFGKLFCGGKSKVNCTCDKSGRTRLRPRGGKGT